jgi:phosphoglycerate kinase
MLENIMDKADYVLIGGGMAATFLKASHYETGRSLIDLDRLETVTRLMKKANANGMTLRLPQDVVVSRKLSLSKIKTVSVENIYQNSKIVDIGPMTVFDFYRVMRKCQTIFWNGTMGIHETPQFAGGTRSVARLLANLDAVTVVGGGSTAESVNGMGLADKMSFVSTGGGATLNFLDTQNLPGLDVLLNNSRALVSTANWVYA